MEDKNKFRCSSFGDNNCNEYDDIDNEELHKKFCPGYSYVPTVIPKVRRIVALGDIHGDYKLCIELLKIARVINDDDNHLKWIGGDTIVVQVGDQIDRCRPYNGNTCNMKETTIDDEHSDLDILKLFTKLDKMAQKNKPPGKVISLLGNHELLNVQGSLNYVSYKGLTKFVYKDSKNPTIIYKSGEEARRQSFRCGNKYSKFLACTRLGAVIIGSNLFVHAGLIDRFIEELKIKNSIDLDDINSKIKKWLLGLIGQNCVKDIIAGNSYSMFWNRILGSLPPDVDIKDGRCSKHISEVLEIFKINSMVIGHTPQSFKFNKQINATCMKKGPIEDEKSGAVWRIDNGSSKAFNIFDEDYMKNGIVSDSRKPQVLEIICDNDFRVLTREDLF